MLVVGKTCRHLFDAATAFDEHLGRRIDHDVGNRRVLEQRFERPEPEQFIKDIFHQLAAFGQVERVVNFLEHFLDDIADVAADLVARHGFQRRQVDPLDQLLVHLHLEIGVEIGLARFGLGHRDRAQHWRARLGILAFGRRRAIAAADRRHRDGDRVATAAPGRPDHVAVAAILVTVVNVVMRWRISRSTRDLTLMPASVLPSSSAALTVGKSLAMV